MSRANTSGIRLENDDIPIVLGMQERGDRDHDIAAWFGVNQGRIAEAKDGRYAHVQPAANNTLPPKGPPGLKGRDLRDAVERATSQLHKEGLTGEAFSILMDACQAYDYNER